MQNIHVCTVLGYYEYKAFVCWFNVRKKWPVWISCKNSNNCQEEYSEKPQKQTKNKQTIYKEGLVRLGSVRFFESRTGPNTIFWASKLRYKSTSNIRSFGGRGLNIFFSLIKAGISVRLSVCLHLYYVENRSSNRLHVWRVCCCDAVSCNMDTFRINKLLINCRTERAGSGAPHRAYMKAETIQNSHYHLVLWQLVCFMVRAGLICSENGHCTSDTKHTGLLRAILLIR